MKTANKKQTTTASRLIVEAFNQGVRVVGVKKSERKGHESTPLFRSTEQQELF